MVSSIWVRVVFSALVGFSLTTRIWVPSRAGTPRTRHQWLWYSWSRGRCLWSPRIVLALSWKVNICLSPLIAKHNYWKGIHFLFTNGHSRQDEIFGSPVSESLTASVLFMWQDLVSYIIPWGYVLIALQWNITLLLTPAFVIVLASICGHILKSYEFSLWRLILFRGARALWDSRTSSRLLTSRPHLFDFNSMRRRLFDNLPHIVVFLIVITMVISNYTHFSRCWLNTNAI